MKNTSTIFAVLLIGSLALPATLRAQSDPMAKWNPNVGDVFDYYYHYHFEEWHHGRQTYGKDDGGIYSDTIVSVNAYYDSLHSSVVVTRHGRDTVTFWLHPSNDTSSALAIDFGSQFLYRLDFANSQVLRAALGTDSITLDHTTAGSYSPDIRWLYSWHVSFNGITDPGFGPDGEMMDSSFTLTSMIKSAVAIPTSSSAPRFTIWSRGDVLYITGYELERVQLVDLIGRPVRAWRVSAEAGESQITLNVADVPSGVYFLKLTAPGVEEVRKVCIAH